MLLLALAIAPGIAIILFVYFNDKYEKEPVTFLFKNFLFGILSAAVAIVISLALGEFYIVEDYNVFDKFIEAFIIVAMAEELGKYIFLKRIAFKSPHFNEPYDGIVYSVMISMGFATIENIMYSFTGGFGTALIRMFTAVPAHATFAIIMGYFVGLAKFKKSKTLLSVIGLLGAIVLHGTYDFFLFISFIPGLYIGAFISLGISIYLSLRAIRVHQKNSPFKNH